MTQPPFSGQPQPVQGVTGGPPVLGGQISNDPSTGNVVIAPNPGNVLQIRKGSNPQSLQVYEYFHSNTDYARVALNTQTNGPYQLQVETAPSTVIRELDINANGALKLNSGNAPITLSANGNNGLVLNPNGIVLVGGQLQTGTVAVPSAANTLNLAGGTTAPFSIIFSIGGAQPWSFTPSNQFAPTATNTYDIGTITNRVRQIFLTSLDLSDLGQGNGAVATLPPTRGSAFGPAAAAAIGWMRFFSGGAAIYTPYWQ